MRSASGAYAQQLRQIISLRAVLTPVALVWLPLHRFGRHFVFAAPRMATAKARLNTCGQSHRRPGGDTSRRNPVIHADHRRYAGGG